MHTSFLFLGLCALCYGKTLDVPPSCAKSYDLDTIKDLYRSSEDWKHLSQSALQEKLTNWIVEHGGKAYGLTGTEFFNLIRIFNITAYDLTWQQALYDEFLPILYCNTTEVMNIMNWVVQSHLSSNTKLYLLSSWLMKLTHETIVDPANLPTFWNNLKTQEPWKTIFGIDKDKFIDRIEQQVVIRPCVPKARNTAVS